MSKRFATSLLLCVWLVVIILSGVLCALTKKTAASPHQQTMLKATALAQQAFDEIKQYKQQHGIEIVEDDKLQTGMLGVERSILVTTDGILKSKRTSVNPHWAAVVISMFVKAGLKEGDQVLMVFSGSFPALNICAMAAGEVYGLDMCLMGSIGASNYGATNENFNFFHITEHLYKQGVLKNRLDVVSLGGSKDCGRNFGIAILEDVDVDAWAEDYRTQARSEITSVPSIYYVEEPNYEANINLRMDYVTQNAPDVKFVLNVGGSMVGLGVGVTAHIQSGYVSPGLVVNNNAIAKEDKNHGLLQRYLQKGIPVASLLNMQGLADEYGIAYDPDQLPDATDVSQSNVYFTTKHNPIILVVALLVTVAVAVVFCVLRVKNKIEVKQNERNHILRRR